jgi:hypothetical protein
VQPSSEIIFDDFEGDPSKLVYDSVAILNSSEASAYFPSLYNAIPLKDCKFHLLEKSEN